MDTKHVSHYINDVINSLQTLHTELKDEAERVHFAFDVDPSIEKMRAGEHKNFIVNVRRWLEEREYSQNAFAMKSGIPQKTVWVTLNNKNAPTLPMCMRFADAMGVPLVKLLEDPK